MLTIYKASAGSGKTFRLVVDYLKLVVTHPASFRYILAVTFTNKATAEMKERILEHLGRMANDRESPYLERIMDETGLPEGEVRERASRALGQLLFDYDRFAVSTIDKFTQRVLKAFNKEAGLNPAYQIETNTELLLAEASDRLIARVGENRELLTWLESFIREKISNNQSFTIENDLKKLGEELFRERLQKRMSLLTAFFEEGKAHHDYLKLLRSIMGKRESELKQMAVDLVKIYRDRGFTVDDFSYKKSGVAGFLEKLSIRAPFPEIPARPRKAAEEPEAWAAKSHPEYGEIMELASTHLQPAFSRLVEYYDQHAREYFSAEVILKQWYTAAVLADLNSEINTLSREKGILPLAGSNLLLSGVIDGSDTPFVYEKMGNIYRHFMLDEFQDTSEMQWENFKPLVENAMAGGFRSLVVGDVKQSIYRWRNSNWDILDRQVAADFSHFPIKSKSLVTNYRSRSGVIRFNNHFFGKLPEIFTQLLQEAGSPAEYSARMTGIYGDARQEFAGSPEDYPGFVDVEALSKDEGDFIEVSLKRITRQIRELYSRGYQAGDIAILVRKKEHGAMIVTHLLQEAALPENRGLDLRVVSSDSLLLKSSSGVQFIIAIFRHLENREDLLTQALLLYLWQTLHGEEVSLADTAREFERVLAPGVAAAEAQLPVSGIDEMIIRIASLFRLTTLSTELPFIRTLADKVAALKLSQLGGIPELISWWEERGATEAVSVNEVTDAIRVLTIHKAKGLEFKVVLMPLTDWQLIHPSGDILWCVPREAPFNRAPLVPVNFSRKLADTIFADDYHLEYFSQLVDNLNLVYVAFTRAKEVLWVNIPAESDFKRIGGLITAALKDMAAQPGFEETLDEEGATFSLGSLPPPSGNEVDPGSDHISDTPSDSPAVGSPPESPSESLPENDSPQWVFHDFSDRLRLRTGNDDFLTITQGGSSVKNLGKIIHSILAEITVAEDLELACRKALASGELQPREYEQVRSELEKMVNHPVGEEWFRGEYRVLNERTLLSPELTLRPDRIMTAGDKAIVADYKSGEVRSSSHRNQVVRYCETLMKAGFREVSGYIWYVRENELLKVFPEEKNP